MIIKVGKELIDLTFTHDHFHKPSYYNYYPHFKNHIGEAHHFKIIMNIPFIKSTDWFHQFENLIEISDLLISHFTSFVFSNNGITLSYMIGFLYVLERLRYVIDI